VGYKAEAAAPGIVDAQCVAVTEGETYINAQAMKVQRSPVSGLASMRSYTFEPRRASTRSTGEVPVKVEG
jgi:hypothetical protein